MSRLQNSVHSGQEKRQPGRYRYAKCSKVKHKEILISQNKKYGTKMVVIHRIVDGKKNRLGKPYIISETKHLGYKKKAE